MYVKITTDNGWVRILITDLEAWSGNTFFTRLDGVVEEITTAIKSNTGHKILFDCSQIEHLDTSAVSVIVQTVRLAGNRTVALYAPHSAVRSLIELLGIGRIIKVVATEAELETL